MIKSSILAFPLKALFVTKTATIDGDDDDVG